MSLDLCSRFYEVLGGISCLLHNLVSMKEIYAIMIAIILHLFILFISSNQVFDEMTKMSNTQCRSKHSIEDFCPKISNDIYDTSAQINARFFTAASHKCQSRAFLEGKIVTLGHFPMLQPSLLLSTTKTKLQHVSRPKFFGVAAARAAGLSY